MPNYILVTSSVRANSPVNTSMPDKRVARTEQVLRRGFQVPPCLLAAAIVVVIAAVGIFVQYTTNVVG